MWSRWLAPRHFSSTTTIAGKRFSILRALFQVSEWFPALCSLTGITNKENIMCSKSWSPDAIVFNSWQHYGCPNYWMLHFFKDSSGATLHPTTIQVDSGYDQQMVASAITWQSPKDKNTYLKIKVVNFGSKAVGLNVSVSGLESGIKSSGSKKTVLTSAAPLDENSFQQPEKVVPVSSPVAGGTAMGVSVSPYSLTSFDLLLEQPGKHSSA